MTPPESPSLTVICIEWIYLYTNLMAVSSLYQIAADPQTANIYGQAAQQIKDNIDLLNELVAKAQEEIHRLTLSSEEARSSLEEVQHSAAQEEQEMNQLKTWADLYDNCTFAAKKMIVSQFIKSIHVYRDYTLEIMFNVTFDEFRKLSADTRNLGNGKAEIYARAE